MLKTILMIPVFLMNAFVELLLPTNKQSKELKERMDKVKAQEKWEMDQSKYLNSTRRKTNALGDMNKITNKPFRPSNENI